MALPVKSGGAHSPGQAPPFRVSFSFSGDPCWSRGGRGSRIPAGCVGTLVVKACGRGPPAEATLGQNSSGERGGRCPHTNAVGWACLSSTRGRRAGPTGWPGSSSLGARAEAAAGADGAGACTPCSRAARPRQPAGSPLRRTLVPGASTGCLTSNPHSSSGRC